MAVIRKVNVGGYIPKIKSLKPKVHPAGGHVPEAPVTITKSIWGHNPSVSNNTKLQYGYKKPVN